MPGEKSKLTPIETRKQLLLLESDLNRAQFIEAMQEWKDEFHRTKEHLTRLGSMAALVARLAGTISTVRRLFSRPAAGGKKSWLSFLFDGMTAGTSLWYMLRSQRRKQDD
jgi:hypothetical protein